MPCMAAAYKGGAACPPSSRPRTAAGTDFCASGNSNWTLLRHAELDSTNAEARRLLALGAAAGTAVLADRQSAGKGRQARAWESCGPQGLWVSLILESARPLECLAQSTLVLGVAVREAVAEATGLTLETKWPNDLLAGDRKCCGLLVETGPLPEGPLPTPLILGIGLNINQTQEDFGPELRERATSLRLLSGREHRRMDLLAAILGHVERWFGLWETEGFPPVRRAWRGNNHTLGRKIILPEGYGASQGTALDLDPEGALLARTDTGAIVRVDAGEILFSSDGRKANTAVNMQRQT